MNKTHNSRKREIEMQVKIRILQNNLKEAIDICQKYDISPKRFSELAVEVNSVAV